MKCIWKPGVIALIVCVCTVGVANAQPAKGIVATQAQPLSGPDQQTVVINDINLLQNSGVDFSLSRTLGQIITTALGPAANTPASRLNFMKAMMRTFALTSATNPLSGVTLALTPRPGELALNPADLLDATNVDGGMHPVGLFDRLDLMPANAAYCGEYRIIYEMGVKPPPSINHFTLIFEAALDNPHPEQGAAGCLPVAQFWMSLRSLTGTPLAQALEQFYYTGIPGASGPVVDFKNYGNPFGQVRTSTFANGDADWRMRTWLIKKTSTGGLTFALHVMVNNPMISLYQVPDPNDPPQLTALRGEFQNEYINSFVQQLTAVDMTGWQQKITDTTFFFKLGVNFEDKYADFESSQQADIDEPLTHVDPQFAQNIQTALDSLGLPWAVSSTEILGRADVQSCGGCHRGNATIDVAPSSKGHGTIAWPGTLPFLHEGELGELSHLLTDRFLPSRFANLTNFVAQPQPGAVSHGSPAMVQQAIAIRAAIRQLSFSSDPAVLRSIDRSIEKVRQQDRRTPGFFVPLRPAD